MIDNWWNEVESTILECLRNGGPMSPAELGRRIGSPHGEATAFLAMLVAAGKVQMPLVEPAATPESRSSVEEGA